MTHRPADIPWSGTPEAVGTLERPAEQGVTPLAPGRWHETDPAGERELTDNEPAHERASGVLTDEELAPPKRLRNGLGLLDLLDDYSVTPAVVGDDVRELRSKGSCASRRPGPQTSPRSRPVGPGPAG